LTFQVEGHTCGDVIEFSGKRTVRIRATARSILPFGSLEIVVNGDTAAIKRVSVSDSHAADGIFSVGIDTLLELDRSSWLAARVAEDPDSKERILPRGLTVFAHSNPIYFLCNGARVRELPSIQYLQKYVKGTMHWLTTMARFATPREKEEA